MIPIRLETCLKFGHRAALQLRWKSSDSDTTNFRAPFVSPGGFSLFPFLGSPGLPFPPTSGIQAPMPALSTGAFDGTPNTPAFNLAQLLGRQITEEIKVKLGPEDGNQKEEKRFTNEVIHACLNKQI